MSRWLIYNQLWHLTRALFKEIIREPGVLFWGILFPILMTLGLGLAFTQKSDVIRKVAVTNGNEKKLNPGSLSPLGSFLNDICEINQPGDKDEYKWKLVLKDEKLGNSIFFFYEMDWQQATVMLKRGTINVVLLDKGDNQPEYHFDPMNPDAQLTFMKLTRILEKGRSISTESNDMIRPLTVTGTRYIDFLVPGLIAMGVMMSCMWGISYGLIEKRSKKLLRRLVATPMKKSHFLIAQISVRFAMNFIESLVLFIFAIIVFKMTVQGDVSSLVAVYIAGNIAFSGIAIFISSHTSNTEVGNGLINFIVFPMMVLSGVFFSYHNFPDWSIPFIKALPLTMLNDGMRSIINEGAGYAEVVLPIFMMTVIGVVFFTAGMKIFKWH
jgi:ABC-type multidrug transport system permease subunit